MADAIPPMIIDIQLKTDQLKVQINNLESKFNGLGNAVNKAQNPFKNFGSTIRTLLPAVGLAGMVMFTKQVIAAGEESKKSDARLQQIATSMGIFGGGVTVVTDRLKTYADQMARQTGIDDDVIKKTQAKLLTFRELALSANTMGGAFDRATAAAVDMAAAGFGDATSNAVQLGKALNDPIKGVTALTRSGITFTAAEKAKISVMVQSGKALEAQKFVLEAIEKQVGGTAKATASATDRMKQAYGQVQEAIGLALLPMLEKFADWFTSVAPKIENFFKQLNDPTTEVGKKWADFTGKVEGAFKWIIANADAIKAWAIAIGIAVLAFKALETAMKLATIAQWLYNVALNANPIGLAIIGISALVGWYMALQTATGNAAKKQKEFNDYLQSGKDKYGLGKVGPVVRDIWGGQDPNVTTRKGDAGLAAAIKAQKAADALNNLGDLYTGADPTGAGTAKEKAAKARAAADAKFVTALKKTQKDITDANETYNKAVEAANDKYGALIKQYSDEMTNIVQTSMNRLRDAFRSAVETNVGDVFKDLVDKGKATTNDLLGALKSRLEAAKMLADNSAALAGAGFSQTFIEQVISQGPDLGNQLAEMLKNATPESQKELQDLFGKTEVLADTGMDKLAQTLYDKTGLATSELKKLYDAANSNMKKAQEDLAAALLSAANVLNESMTKIQSDFDKTLEAMAESAKKHAKTIADLMAQIAASQSKAVTAGATNKTGSSVPYANTIATPFSASQSAWNAISVPVTINQTDPSVQTVQDGVISAVKYGTSAVSYGNLTRRVM